ncbi:uncharacterized protein Fot_35658 [Forsythia ovata]|uniref:Retrotransposon gag domain-containing protein n=1 Tax=Forsythia ovata TaxID=205694 RepID=A0ABD1SMF8_9LAMI
MTSVEYIAKFKEFMLRYNVNEESLVTLSRFRTGLRLELQRELIPHDVNSLDQSYQLVQELERYLKTNTVAKRFNLCSNDLRATTFGAKPNSAPKSSYNTSKPKKNDKGK